MSELSTPRPADRADLVRIFIFLVVVFAAAIAGVATVWGMTNRSGDVALEVAKGCIQVAGVAVIGGIVTWLFSRHLRRQEAEAKARDDELAELRRRNLAAADLRRRQDKFLRTMLNDTLTAYNDVKRIRRLLRGKLDEPDHKRLAEELSEDQLEFERLREIAKLVNDDRIPVVFTWNTRSYEAQPVALVQMFDMIEKSLNKVLDDQRASDAFLSKIGFAAVADPKDAILAVLQKALLEPIHQMTLDDLRAEQSSTVQSPHGATAPSAAAAANPPGARSTKPRTPSRAGP